VRRSLEFRLKTLLCLLAALTTACAFAQRTQISPEEIRSLEASPAVVLIAVPYEFVAAIPTPQGIVTLKRTRLSTGSGFLYRPDGYLITNAHVVSDAHANDAEAEKERERDVFLYLIALAEKLNQRPMTDIEKAFIYSHMHIGNAVIKVFLSNNNKVNYAGEIKAYGEPTSANGGKDIAIIKIDANNLPTVPLGNSDDVHVEEPVMVIGYPGAASPMGELSELLNEESLTVPTVTNGHISAVNKMNNMGSQVLQSDATISHGSSGGPAFDPDGKVIGISTFGAQEAAGFNFFVPINTAMEFVRQVGAAPESGSFDAAWHAALDAIAAQHWSRAHGLLGNVLEIMPGQPDALRLQVIAAQEAQKETPEWVLPAAGAAVLILAVALVGWLVISARSRNKAPVAVRTEPARLSPQVPHNVQPSPPASERPPTVLAGNVLAPTVFAGGSPAEKRYGTLHVTSGALTGSQYPIPKTGVLIGRDSAKCNIVVQDESVSKEHAWIVPIDNEVVLIDRNSTNGTYVNSQESPRVNKATLRNGDRVYIGRSGELTLTYFTS
jgi:serine protease Do